MKHAGLLVLGTLLGAVGLYAYQLRTADIPVVEGSQELEAAYATFSDAIRESGEFVQSHQWYGSEREQAEAYRHIVRVMINILRESVLVDPDFPYFFDISPFSKTGMDNADQVYYSTMIEGDAVYRIWGNRGSSRSLSFSIYEQDALSRSMASLEESQLLVDEDGAFELILGGPPREGNWLPLEPGRLRLLVRHIHSDWSVERPGDVHIDRIDAARPVYPQFDREIMGQRLVEAANLLALNVRRWPEYSRTRFEGLMPANSLSPPQEVGSTGGLTGRLMVGGHFNLQPDEAMIIKAWPSGANYQGIQLGHHWWESLDYANRQSSLTADQARVSSDGAYYFVISRVDPGVTNWLDTEGFGRGVILMRYDGLQAPELPDNQRPSASVVKLSQLKSHLPADEPVLLAQERKSQIESRRRHVQLRFGI